MKIGVSILFYSVVAYATYLMILIALPHLALQSGIDFLQTKQPIYHLKLWRWSFYIHIFSAIPVLFFGIFQFSRFVLKKHPKIHRTSGLIYATILLLLAAPSGLIMSFYANGGLIAQLGFVLMSLLWILTTILALYDIKQKNHVSHGKWMLRSYALTFAAVTLRFYGFLVDYFHFNIPPKETYILLAYLSWIPNLVIAEILIRFRFIDRLIQKNIR